MAPGPLAPLPPPPSRGCSRAPASAPVNEQWAGPASRLPRSLYEGSHPHFHRPLPLLPLIWQSPLESLGGERVAGESCGLCLGLTRATESSLLHWRVWPPRQVRERVFGGFPWHSGGGTSLQPDRGGGGGAVRELADPILHLPRRSSPWRQCLAMAKERESSLSL